jgi:hypothetical protein
MIKRMVIIVIAIVVAPLAGAGFFAYQRLTAAKTSTTANLQTAAVARGNLTAVVSAGGWLASPKPAASLGPSPERSAPCTSRRRYGRAEFDARVNEVGKLSSKGTNMNKRIGLIVGIIVLIVAVGGGSFYGGTVYAAQQTNNTRAAFLNGRGGGTAGGPGGGSGGGGVSGTVKSINGATLQVSTAQNVTTVTLNTATTIRKTLTGTTADLQPGVQVTVRGQADSSGNVTATTIQVVPAGGFPGQGQGPGPGPGATPTPAP